MKINIFNMLEGARAARGVAVIIDVFRAFSLECYIMDKGAARIIPVASCELAYELKDKNPDYLLVGERHGKILPGFDFGNSPSQLESVDLMGKTVIHTTSAGTQGLDGAVNADVVLTGALVNSRAIARYIKSNGFPEISLVAMGVECKCEAPEDTLCAEYIKSLILGEDFDLAGGIETVRNSSEGIKFFNPMQQDVFPERDYELCTQVDRFDFVLKKVNGIIYREG